ncbi:MAG TPA: murein biosynthesis integral membrane protein MurJ [Clostridia bacterium]|nr:murein biosynthesis integral membrane protein MurJ [Clostridia bacterium]
MKKNKTVNTVLMVVYLTIFSKLFGLARDMMIGYRYGTSVESDAYFAAYRMTITIFLSIGSAITATAIPFVVKYIKQGDREKLFGFTGNLMTVLFAAGTLISAAGMFLAPWYVKMIAIGFEGDKLALTVSIVRIFFPVMVLVPLVYSLISFLQSKGKFAITSIVSIPYNLILVSYLIFFNSHFGVPGLAYATLLGWVGQLFILYVFSKEESFSYKAVFGLGSEMRSVFALMVPILFSSAVYNINVLVDSSIASTLADGQLASLNFANIAYTAVSTTMIFGISTVLFPQFSTLAAENNILELKKRISKAIQVMIFIFIPIIFGILAVNKELVQVLYQRGTFDMASVNFTSGALCFYAVGMVGFSIQELANKVFYALKDTKTPFYTSLASVAVNIVLDLILVGIMGIKGLALATSIAVTLNGLLLLHLMQRRLGKLEIKAIVVQLVKVALTGAIMMIVVMGFNLAPITLYLRLGMSIILGIVLYYIMSERIGLPEIAYIKSEINSLREKRKGDS